MFGSKVICCMLWFVLLSFVCGRHLPEQHPAENYVPDPSEAGFQDGLTERRSSGASLPGGLNTDGGILPTASLDDTLEVQRGLNLSSRSKLRSKRYLGPGTQTYLYGGGNSTNLKNNSKPIES